MIFNFDATLTKENFNSRFINCADASEQETKGYNELRQQFFAIRSLHIACA